MPSLTNVAQVAVDGLSLGSLYALLALGVALIFGVMRLVNFAHGELLMIAAFALYILGDQPVFVLFGVAALVACASAFAMEKVAFRPVREADAATLMVTSFAVSFFLQNLAVAVMGAQTRSMALRGVGTGNYVIGDLRLPVLHLWTLVITLTLLGALAILLTRTTIGLHMRAAAEDFEMARLLGVRANRVISAAFVLGGALAGVAAVLYTAQTGTVAPRMGLGPLIVAVVAIVIGGIGNLVGAVAGGFVLGGLTSVLQAWLPLEWRPFRDAFVFTIVIAILLFRPEGLVPSRTSVRV